MKKTVIIILAILPIVLLITIGFAGRILDESKRPRVTKVEFIDYYFNTPLADDYLYELAMNTEKQLKIQITFDQDDPKGKGDKEVTFESLDETVCTVDENGKIYGVNPGTAIIRVTTHDQRKTDELEVLVRARVIGITLPSDTLELTVGDKQKLDPTVNLPEAPQEDKKVTYSSDNQDVVTVAPDGTITAKAVGTATVTASVTTQKGQRFDATCTITVVEGIPAIYFDFSSAAWISKQGDFHITSQAQINLNDFVRCNPEKVALNEIKFKIQSGASNATLEDGVLTLNNTKAVTIRAYVESNPNLYEEIIFELE